MHDIDEGDCFINNKSGNVYRLLMIANKGSDREDFPLICVYQDDMSGEIWARPAEVFLEKNTFSG